MRPERWIERLLRLQRRPLQIPEIVEMAEEHLKAVALEGLERRYLPVRLRVMVSSDDHRALMPFLSDLKKEAHEMLHRLAAHGRYVALAPQLDIELHEAAELKPGGAPRFRAAFPAGVRRATWTLEAPASVPPPLSSLPSPASPSPTSPPPRLATTRSPSPELESSDTGTQSAVQSAALFELILTAASAERTALQTVHRLCLEEALPIGCLGNGLPPSPLVLSSDSGFRHQDTGEPWQGPLPTICELQTRLPLELDSSLEITPGARRSALYRFYIAGSAEVLWSPAGVVLVGRRPELVHWVPGASPPNLSGRHFALLRGAADHLRVVDLRSTNGTYVGARRLEPFEKARVAPPETIEVGQEGALRIDLRRL